IVLSIEDKLNYLEQPIPHVPVAPAEIQRNLEPLHAHEMLKELKTLFAQQAEQELLQTTRDFYSCRQEEGQSVSLYVLKMKGYIDNLERLGMGKTVNELHAMLKLYEQTLPKSNAPALNSIRAGKHKIPPPPKRENPAKDSICHECGEIRHWKRNCPQYLAELMKKKKNTASGAGGSEIVLNNGPYAPSITRGVISVSRLYEDGFMNRFINNTIQVSRYNVVYFCTIPRDGIFEIDLSNSLTNESSVYAVSNKRAKLNLESALLWHCRLGHISKKCIEKLQHDGLLNSSDLTAFEKCVPCMSGKMARKPYTHQVEMAKDLLGLIHTDALVKRDTLTKPDNLEPRAIKCIFVGYPKKTMGYSFYYLPENKVLVARNAEFLENSLIDQEASGSLEDLEIIQEEDTHPFLDTRLNHKEEDLEINEPQSDIFPIRRSTRTRHAPDHTCLYIDTEEHELGDFREPANYKAALLDPESKKWLNDMNVEIKWLFKKKTDMDGNVHIYKARLVAKGLTQTPWIDYEETFSRVVDIRAFRILIAKAAYYDYEIWQMDVKTAFLNGYLNEEEKLKLSKSQGASTPAEMKRMHNVLYASAVGSIMNTKDMFLVYGGDLKRELRVSCYTDARYLTDAVDLKSQTGYVFILNGGAVD
nr:hypothetical protein [Tanacetum cinerariifolium]